MSREFRLPDLGEGVSEGQIIRVLVSEGLILNCNLLLQRRDLIIGFFLGFLGVCLGGLGGSGQLFVLCRQLSL